MRLLERFLGSAKYLSFIALIYLLSLGFIPLVYAILAHIPFLSSSSSSYSTTSSTSSSTTTTTTIYNRYSPPGPTPVVFALLAIYRDLVPPAYKFHLTPTSAPFELHLSDKAFVYILAADLAFLRWPGAFVNAVVGWTLGGLIHNEAIPGKHWRIPFVGAGAGAAGAGAAGSRSGRRFPRGASASAAGEAYVGMNVGANRNGNENENGLQGQD